MRAVENPMEKKRKMESTLLDFGPKEVEYGSVLSCSLQLVWEGIQDTNLPHVPEHEIMARHFRRSGQGQSGVAAEHNSLMRPGFW